MSQQQQQQQQTIAFIGATAGVGLSALKHALAAGHQCIALCRTPSKLTKLFPHAPPNLQVVQGNAKDVAAVTQILTKSDGTTLVDQVVSTIGAGPAMKWGIIPTLDDPTVCQTAMAALLEALDTLRHKNKTNNTNKNDKKRTPHIIVCSTTGMSKFGRDIPYLMIPLYHWLLKVPHADKTVMEKRLGESGETFTVVRCSWMSGCDGASSRPIRVGVEDPRTGREAGWDAIGYTISREDAGTWFADQLLLQTEAKYLDKTVTITY